MHTEVSARRVCFDRLLTALGIAAVTLVEHQTLTNTVNVLCCIQSSAEATCPPACAARTPVVHRVEGILARFTGGGGIVNDHVAFRTFGVRGFGIDSIAGAFTQMVRTPLLLVMHLRNTCFTISSQLSAYVNVPLRPAAISTRVRCPPRYANLASIPLLR